MDKREIRAMHDITTAAKRLCEALRRGGFGQQATYLDNSVKRAVKTCKRIKEKEEKDE